MDSLLELFCHVDDFCTASLSQDVCRTCQTRQNIHRMVLWIYLIVNDRSELIDFVLTPGNVKPVPRLARRLFFGDKGYLSRALRDQLWRMFNVQLITGIRANMMLPLLDKLLLRRQVIVETIVDQLKNISQIEHSRYRSPVNFVVNVLCGLITYCRKPSLNLAALTG